jgi:hypothetical protein
VNPWIAHLENQDLQWIVDHSRGLYLDSEIEIEFPKPCLILDGKLSCRDRVRGGGALLGISEWYLEVKTRVSWIVELPLSRRHRESWSIALAVAMSAEIRLIEPLARDLADVEAATWKFRYVLSRLETTL